jgi:hypothetical protein
MLLYFPIGHGEHVDSLLCKVLAAKIPEFSALNFPSLHNVHDVTAEEPVEYRPEGHTVQSESLSKPDEPDGANVPAGHTVQLDVPTDEVYLPTGQLMQSRALS